MMTQWYNVAAYYSIIRAAPSSRLDIKRRIFCNRNYEWICTTLAASSRRKKDHFAKLFSRAEWVEPEKEEGGGG